MSFFLFFHSFWCRKEKYKKVSECLQIIGLESKYDQNPSFIVRSRNKYNRDLSFIIWSRNKYDQNPSFCDVTTFLRDVYYWCYYWYTRIPWLILIFFVCTVTDVTIGLVCSNRRYDWCFWLEPTLRSVFSPSTNDWCCRLVALLPTLRLVFSVIGPLLPFNVDSTFKL